MNTEYPTIRECDRCGNEDCVNPISGKCPSCSEDNEMKADLVRKYETTKEE